MHKKPNVEVIPYFYQGRIHMTVLMDGVEVFEGASELSTLFDHFVGCIDPYCLPDEDEALGLIHVLESGINRINYVLAEAD